MDRDFLRIIYLKSKLRSDILKNIKRKKHTVSSVVECRECSRSILFFELVNNYYCSVFCRMRHEDRIFRNMCGC